MVAQMSGLSALLMLIILFSEKLTARADFNVRGHFFRCVCVLTMTSQDAIAVWECDVMVRRALVVFCVLFDEKKKFSKVARPQGQPGCPCGPATYARLTARVIVGLLFVSATTSARHCFWLDCCWTCIAWLRMSEWLLVTFVPFHFACRDRERRSFFHFSPRWRDVSMLCWHNFFPSFPPPFLLGGLSNH